MYSIVASPASSRRIRKSLHLTVPSEAAIGGVYRAFLIPLNLKKC